MGEGSYVLSIRNSIRVLFTLPQGIISATPVTHVAKQLIRDLLVPDMRTCYQTTHPLISQTPTPKFRA